MNHHHNESTIYLRLGLEPSISPVCDPNPGKSLPTEIIDLVSGPNEVQVLDVSSKKEFSESQSDREEVDLFRHREKHTPQSVCHRRG